MNDFAHLLDRLAYEPGRNAKLRLLQNYFARTPDPERGWALAAMTGGLSFREAKPTMIRMLAEERIDPVLFALSHNYVGDLAETVALIWPVADDAGLNRSCYAGEGDAQTRSRRGDSTGLSGNRVHLSRPPPTREPPSSTQIGPARSWQANVEFGQAQGPMGEGAGSAPGISHSAPPSDVPTLAEVVETLASTPKRELPLHLARWLDALDETGRWALLKLVTGNLRVGVSARLAKTAVAALGVQELDMVEQLWHGLRPPYDSLFAWVEGKGEQPESLNPVPFRPPMLSHPIDEESDFERLDPAAFLAEWKWDGIRIQLAGGRDETGARVARIYSRTGEDVSGAFPDLAEAITFEGTLDGELLILREGRVQSFNVLQQRLNRKCVTPKLLQDFPAHVRVYDILAANGEDLRELALDERRQRLEAFVAYLDDARVDLSPLVPFVSWDELAQARADPAAFGVEADADAVEGVMLKRRDSAYLAGRPKGPWWKWKRDPYRVDAVMMYAQRGHGKRSSYYSDYTFGCWRQGPDGREELVPVGKAYHGFTDAELLQLDRHVRNNTVNRFGPVREVAHGRDAGLVLEIAFEGVQRSSRHKSGVAMRFPRVARIRWDKSPAEADRLEVLEAILAGGEREIAPAASRLVQ